MSLNKQLIEKKLDTLNKHLARVERMKFDQAELEKNYDIQDLLAFRIQQSVETCIDIAAHIVSSTNMPRKETAKDTIRTLGNEGVISKKLAESLAHAADFRNRVVHGYNDFDFALLYKDYTKNIADLRNFGAEIVIYMHT